MCVESCIIHSKTEKKIKSLICAILILSSHQQEILLSLVLNLITFLVTDLYGLMLFLGEDPYWVKCWFDKLLYTPLCYGIEQPMYDLVSRVLWRTVKRDVLDQVMWPLYMLSNIGTKSFQVWPTLKNLNTYEIWWWYHCSSIRYEVHVGLL